MAGARREQPDVAAGCLVLACPSYGTQLSPREEEVARLAASGLTNRDIAHTLHLSVWRLDGRIRSRVRPGRRAGTGPCSGRTGLRSAQWPGGWSP
ncbi:LuxR C-terminal-related transcriptional regulator [Streptomyces sp. NPDC054842]